jgi:beta-glucanase (GH16 family)
MASDNPGRAHVGRAQDGRITIHGRGAIVALAVAVGVLLLSVVAHAATLDLSGLKLVLDENFHNLSVSSKGPGTRWTAHTPWGGDFGDAQFADPQPGFPFSVTDGVGRIELRKSDGGRWQSGLLSSVDPQGNGFTLQYGYFEIRAKLPAGPGVWPAFWLDSMPPSNSPDPSIEIDILEHYGKFPYTFNSTVTVWPKIDKTARRSEMKINQVPSGSLSAAFHAYGVMVDPKWIVFYFDRNEVWRVPTPPEHRHGLMILIDLGLGSGWPIDHTPNPSYMYIEYVRAWAPA